MSFPFTMMIVRCVCIVALFTVQADAQSPEGTPRLEAGASIEVSWSSKNSPKKESLGLGLLPQHELVFVPSEDGICVFELDTWEDAWISVYRQLDPDTWSDRIGEYNPTIEAPKALSVEVGAGELVRVAISGSWGGTVRARLEPRIVTPQLDLSLGEDTSYLGVLTARDPAPFNGARRDSIKIQGASRSLLNVSVDTDGGVEGIVLVVTDDRGKTVATVPASPEKDGTITLRWRIGSGERAVVDVWGSTLDSAYRLRVSRKALKPASNISLGVDNTLQLSGSAGDNSEVFDAGVYRERIYISPSASGILCIEASQHSESLALTLLAPDVFQDGTQFLNEIAWSNSDTGDLMHRVSDGVRYQLVVDRTGKGEWSCTALLHKRKAPFVRDSVALGSESIEYAGVLGFLSGVEEDNTLIEQHSIIPETDGLLEAKCTTEGWLRPLELVWFSDSGKEVVARSVENDGIHRLARLVTRGKRYAIVIRDQRSSWEKPDQPSSREHAYHLHLALTEREEGVINSEWQPILRSARPALGGTPLASPNARFITRSDPEGIRVIDARSRLPLGFVRGGFAPEFVWGGDFLACEDSSGVRRLFSLRDGAAHGLPASFDPGSSLLEVDVAEMIRELGVPASRSSNKPVFSASKRRLALIESKLVTLEPLVVRDDWVTVLEFPADGNASVVFEDSITARVEYARTYGELRFDASGTCIAALLRNADDDIMLYHADLGAHQVITRELYQTDEGNGGSLAATTTTLVPIPGGRHVLLQRSNASREWWSWQDIVRGEVATVQRHFGDTKYSLLGVLESGEGVVLYSNHDDAALLKICTPDGEVRNADAESISSLSNPYWFAGRVTDRDGYVVSLFRAGGRDPLIDMPDLLGGIQAVDIVGATGSGRFLRVRFGEEANWQDAVVDLASMHAEILESHGASRWSSFVERLVDGETRLLWRPWWDNAYPLHEITSSRDGSTAWRMLHTPDRFDHRAFQHGRSIHFVDWSVGTPQAFSILRADDERVRQAQLDLVFKRALIWTESKRLELYALDDGSRIPVDGDALRERYPYLATPVLPSLCLLLPNVVRVDSVLLGTDGRVEYSDLGRDVVMHSPSNTWLTIGRLVGAAAPLDESQQEWPSPNEWDTALIAPGTSWRLPDGHTPLRFTGDSKTLVSRGPRSELAFWDTQSGALRFSIGIDANGGVLAILPDGRYFGPRELDHMIGFTDGNRVVPAKALDAEYNRPGEVLEIVGFASAKRVEELKSARERRLSRLGPRVVEPSGSAPKLASEVPLRTDQSEITLIVDSRADAGSLRVRANGRLLPGSPWATSRDGMTTIPIPLIRGTNRIALWTVSDEGRSHESLIVLECDSDDSRSTTWYLGIGISEYAEQSMSLHYAAKDTLDLAQALEAVASSKFESLLLLDQHATRDGVIAARSFLERAKPGDRIFVHIAGHGLLTDDGSYRFATHDTDFDHPVDSGLGFAEIDELLAGLPTPEVWLFMDTCHAGELEEAAVQIESAVEGVVRRTAKRGLTVTGVKNPEQEVRARVTDLFTDLRDATGITVYAASGGEQYAIESRDVSNGVFTRAVIEGLAMGTADRDNDTHVNREELRTYLITRVNELTSGAQRPQIRRESGDLRRPVASALRPTQQLTTNLDGFWVKRIRMGETGPLVMLGRTSDDTIHIRMLDRNTGAMMWDVPLVEKDRRLLVDILSVAIDGTTLLDNGNVMSPKHGLLKRPDKCHPAHQLMTLSRSGAFAVYMGSEENTGSITIMDLKADVPQTVTVLIADDPGWAYTSSMLSAALGPHPDEPNRIQISLHGYVLEYNPATRTIIESVRVPWNETPIETHAAFLAAWRRNGVRPHFDVNCPMDGEFSTTGRYYYRHSYANPLLPEQQQCQTLVALRTSEGKLELVKNLGNLKLEQPLWMPSDVNITLGIRSEVRDGHRVEVLGDSLKIGTDDVMVNASIVAKPLPRTPDRIAWAFTDLDKGIPIGWFRSKTTEYTEGLFHDGMGGVWLRERDRLLRFMPTTRTRVAR